MTVSSSKYSVFSEGLLTKVAACGALALLFIFSSYGVAATAKLAGNADANFREEFRKVTGFSTVERGESHAVNPLYYAFSSGSEPAVRISQRRSAHDR